MVKRKKLLAGIKKPRKFLAGAKMPRKPLAGGVKMATVFKRKPKRRKKS